jgi:Flp pilus assembly pilin Flp
MSIKSAMSCFVRDESGAAASEYAILVAVIVVAVYAAVKLFNLNTIFGDVNNKVQNCVSGTNCT